MYIRHIFGIVFFWPPCIYLHHDAFKIRIILSKENVQLNFREISGVLPLPDWEEARPNYNSQHSPTFTCVVSQNASLLEVNNTKEESMYGRIIYIYFIKPFLNLYLGVLTYLSTNFLGILTLTYVK